MISIDISRWGFVSIVTVWLGLSSSFLSSPIAKAASTAGSPKRSPAKIEITLVPNGGNIVPGGTIQISATIVGTSTQSIKWEIVGGDDRTGLLGKVSSSGLYTAPAKAPPSGRVSVRATSMVDGVSGATASFLINDSVSVNPLSATVPVGDKIFFAATVNNATTKAVQWLVNGIPGGNTKLGVITPDGKYTAPRAIPETAVRVTAVYMSNNKAAGSADLTIIDDSIERSHRIWQEGVAAAAASLGCTDVSVQQQANEALTDAIAVFDLTATNGSCLVLHPISNDPNSLRYSISWGGKTIGGKDLLYISDVGKARIWNGAPVVN